MNSLRGRLTLAAIFCLGMNGLVLGSPVDETLISSQAIWRYEQSGQALADNWKEPSFNDSHWDQGQGLFGTPASEPLPAGEQIRTELTLMQNAYYFRVHFSFTQDPSLFSLVFSNVIDDGAVLYLNGQEIKRVAMPEGSIDSTTRATRASDVVMTGRDIFSIPRPTLNMGDNVLAVEVHQGGTSSGDLVWGTTLNAVRGFGPTFTLHPQSTNVLQGRSATLTALALGENPPTYQWFFASNLVLNATNSTLTISNIIPDQAGSYFVRATGFSGIIDSSAATVGYVADSQAPIPLRAQWTATNTILLTFDEAVADPSQDPFAYAITGGEENLIVVAARIELGERGSNVVVLTTSPARDFRYNYRLQVLAGSDLFGNNLENQVELPLATPQILFPLNSIWKFNESNIDLGTTWREPSYDDSAWPSGPGVLAQEDAAVLQPFIGTDLRSQSEGGPKTTYFRAHFNLPHFPPTYQSLSLSYWLDDGAVVFINGQEVHRRGVATNQNHSTDGQSLEVSALEGPFSIPLSSLVQGDNVMAAEVHQAGATSSDVVWGAQLMLVTDGVIECQVFFHQPAASQTVNEGATVTFHSPATGPSPISYQWYHDGIPISGATSASLTIPFVTSCDTGEYYVEARAPNCWPGTSPPITLWMFDDPPYPPLRIRNLTSGQVEIRWTAGPQWKLASAADPAGPYLPLPDQPSAPFLFTPTSGTTQFFRLFRDCP